MSRMIKILILSSLLLNILLIGIIIGYVSHRMTREHFMRRYRPEFTVKLPSDKEDLFFKTMEEVNEKNRNISK